MKLRLEQLAAHVAKPLLPIYVISGEEPFQMDQACQSIRQAAQQQGFSDRQTWEAEQGTTQSTHLADPATLLQGSSVP